MPGLNLTHHRITVLLVDDQPIVGEAVGEMFAGEQDIDFHYCPDPREAIKTANRICPTVILLDLVMPQIEGLVLVRYFRANKATREVPLIVLSSKEDPRIKAESFALGANDYMVKLPDRLEVLARVRYHSRGYINLLERNEAYSALLQSREQLDARNKFIRKTFGRYVTDDIVNAILESPEGTQLGGEKRRVTILMSDLRGFTCMSERLAAESVLSIINIYLAAMTEIIMKYDGTIDEFIGDAILVIFGAPLKRENDAKRAVACALEMQLAMEKVNLELEESGYSKVFMGIGIHTGEVVAGNIGSDKRTKYGVVGQTVNLTGRIESYTVGGQILISEATFKNCAEILRIDNRMQVMPKGVKEPITLFEVGGIGAEFNVYRPLRERTELPKLKTPLPVKFTVLEGKHAGAHTYNGSIEKLVDDSAEVHAEFIPEHLANLKVHVFDREINLITDQLYGKVIECFHAAPAPSFRMSFTSVPSELEAFFCKIQDFSEKAMES